MSLNQFEFRCAACGELHRGSPSFSYPEPPISIPETDRQTRVQLTQDTCVVDGEIFYIRALLELPIIGAKEPLSWGVWVSQSQESFDRYVETFHSDQSGMGTFGWLPVTMPDYVGTNEEKIEYLACDIAWQAGDLRPIVKPHSCEHPLYADYLNGMDWDRAIKIAQMVLHAAD